MTDETTTRNIALLIDADNASPQTLNPVLTTLAAFGTINIRRVYGNWASAALKGWSELTVRYGIAPQQQFDLTKGKNATDMKMTIDAMDLLYSGHVDGFGIMSSDSDFTPLATRIRQNGIPVYGFGEGKTPEAFRNACTAFIDVGAPGFVKPDPAAPAAAVVTANARSIIGPEVVHLFLDAFEESRHDADGYASVADMGRLVSNRSSFNVRSYGYKRLSDLVEVIPDFEAQRRDGGQMFVRRVS